MNYKTKILLAFIALIVFYFGYKSFSSRATISSLPNPSVDKEAVVQEKWTKFNSDFLKLSLSYPESWKISEHPSGYYIELKTNIPNTDKGNMFYSIFVTRQDNPEHKSFEDFVFPKDTYNNADRSVLYSKSTSSSFTIYKTDNLISQSGSLHYFITKDGSVYFNIDFFPYYPDHPVINQDKIIDYLNKITSTLEITDTTANQTQIIQYKQVSVPERSDLGSCWTTSISTPSNKKAWRCSAGNSIYDPCFDVGDNKVVCDPDPEKANSGLTLKLTEKLPVTNDRPKFESTHPWIYELANNIKCFALTGTAESIEGDFYYYACDNKALMRGDLSGNSIQKNKQPWMTTIVYLDNNFKVSKKETLPILKVWW